MSNFDNAHSVVGYVSGTKPLTNQRWAKVLFKASTSIDAVDGSKVVTKRDNVAVSVPIIASDDILSRMNSLVPAIRKMLEDAQDKIVRERVVSADAKLIGGSEISVAACIEWLGAEATGERLTKESIAAWFDGSVADSLALAFSEKLGIGENPSAEESAKVLAIVSDYSSKIQMLAGGKTSFAPAVAEKLEKALQIAAPDDELAGKFMARLAKMKVAVTADLLGL